MVAGKLVMNDVIQKVVATEAEAKRMVLAAKSEADRILSAAQKRAQELTATARKDVQLEAQNILAQAMAEAEKNQQARLASVAAGMEKQVYLDAAARRQAVEAVIRCVCGKGNCGESRFGLSDHPVSRATQPDG
jgi:vacuolar-type H+-ATPase subunit H